MANKETILNLTIINNNNLLSELALLNISGVISRPQLNTIHKLCKPELPTRIELRQRTPKGIINVWIAGVEKYHVNTRSKVFYK
jgi:hypothetical protein